MLQLSKSRVLRQSAVSSRSAVAFKVSSSSAMGVGLVRSKAPITLQSHRSVAPNSQPVRAVSIKAATEDVEVANNGAVGASAAANMLDFEELSDIVRSGRGARQQGCSLFFIITCHVVEAIDSMPRCDLAHQHLTPAAAL